jgi:protein-arginine kinase activator protein McsA
MTEFGDKKKYTSSHLSTSVTNGVSQSWLKLRLRPIDKQIIEDRLTDDLEKENYERCAVLRDVLKKI